ncbi:hypothetical protein [Paludibaculum fermentans]|uniref:hypothetical protein n=1 Tax=Paludibaculum fermentans TaxID=1473598 RepID=UPI003EC0A458
MIVVRSALAFVAFAFSVLGADYCSLKVIVSYSQGGAPDVPVIVQLAEGRALKKNNQAEGVMFCDLGINPVNITIGDGCRRVTISNVALKWGQMQVVRALYDPCLIQDRPPGSACEILLMARDESGTPLGGASVQFTEPVPVSFLADTNGRVLTGFGFGKLVKGSIASEGFAPALFSFRCTTADPTIEKEVLLKRLP